MPEFEPGFKFKNVMSDFVAEVKEVQEKDNNIVMKVISPRRQHWFEDWNLAHTINGFKDGTYVALEENHE